ncbi:MAG TPA: GatB/YqeY domain-containing protein [Candidatus Yonathbacteria bacterium]|nr:GatB/YqeY domain-containing protein [Candidatus Yonathbacteria bacterium]
MIQKTIRDELKNAMRARDSLRLEVLRSVLTGFTNELVAKGKTPQDEIDDDMALTVIARLAKQRKDSIEQFMNAGRKELADKEKTELVILEKYLPEMMNKEDVAELAKSKKAKLGINDKSKSGILIGAIMKDLKGKADGGMVKNIVDELFD